jgi:hypothetical protein
MEEKNNITHNKDEDIFGVSFIPPREKLITTKVVIPNKNIALIA